MCDIISNGEIWAMKREALIRELRKEARKRKMAFKVYENEGKGSHYRVLFGTRVTTIKPGELRPGYVNMIRKQLGIID